MSALTWLVAVPAAIGAAASFGGAGFLQHQAARSAPESGPLQPTLLVQLVQIPRFRYSVVLSALGFVLQVLALRFAPLPVVQPLLVTGVLFYLLFARLTMRKKLDRLIVLAAVLALLGLSAFLLVARPRSGHEHIGPWDAVWLGIALVAAVAVCLSISKGLPDEWSVVPIAIATACCYGATAGLVRSLLISGELHEFFLQWQLYAIIVVAPAGFLLNQHAFQEGAFGSVAVATINVGDPIVSILIGLLWLGDSLSPGLWRTFGEVVALVAMAGGVSILANRAQTVADELRREPGASLEQAT
ncbi:MAG TPA: DMT family transporter [Segeticoccus sp.]|uniref:DMT family transporter n=1 Tax=Segeticoccus sp. TaxID=2706531 RepID=UPI002D80C216|nr:DMT family transporter [Segeticoccus sp.]HET8600780.1 DMT family transporter [Segeticoccus sp.]